MASEESLYVRLYFDEDVHKRVAAGLRLRNFDVISAHEIDQLGLTDEKQLETAASLDRALFTFNASDYIRLHLDRLREGRPHAGIIVSDQVTVGMVVRRLLDLLNRITPEEMPLVPRAMRRALCSPRSALCISGPMVLWSNSPMVP